MAAENPQATPPGASVPGAAPAGAPAKSGLAAILPLLVAVVVMPLAAWGTLKLFLPESGTAQAADQREESAPSDSSSKSKKAVPDGRDAGVPIPLTTASLAWLKADGTDQGRMVYQGTSDEARPERVVVNIANTEGKRYAVASISFLGDHPELLHRVNDKKFVLRQAASILLASKTLDEMTRGNAFHEILRAELIQHFNRILGPGSVQDVVISDFLIQ